MTDKKYKIVMVSDTISAISGVSLQTRYIIDHLVKTGMFQIICLGAAMKHPDYRPQKFQEWGDSVVNIPTDGFAPINMVRQILDIEKPDAFWIMSDPRFYEEFFSIENEVRQQCPILWNVIWDNYPVPLYNKHFYAATDFLGCINKLTFDIMKQMGFDHKAKYIPHGVPKDTFKILDEQTVKKAKIGALGIEKKDAFVLFYNSRNALRKRTGNAIVAFKEFLETLPENERDNCLFCMQSPPNDPEGQNLFVVVDALELKGKVAFTNGRVDDKTLCEFYNFADVTICPSSEEGFGLSCLESLMCGTPVIATKTGGLQDQVADPETQEVFGACLKPDARSYVGSQQTPFIWSDHVDPSTLAKEIKKIYDLKKSNKNFKDEIAGQKCRESVLRRFNLEEIQKTWEQEIVQCIESYKEKIKNNDRQAVEI